MGKITQPNLLLPTSEETTADFHTWDRLSKRCGQAWPQARVWNDDNRDSFLMRNLVRDRYLGFKVPKEERATYGVRGL